MNSDRKKILDMLARGTITAEEAEKLLDALDKNTNEKPKPNKDSLPKFLHVKVKDKEDRVNITIPLNLVKSGIKLASLMPEQVQSKVDSAMKSKGMNFNLSNIGKDNINDILIALKDFSIDVETDNDEEVKIYCE